ncbi:MAG: DUF1003 domain-containing protein [Arcticibacter sp.]
MNEDNQSGTMTEKSRENMKRLHDIVQKTMEEEQLIVNNLLHPPQEVLSRGQQISDKVARFGGSWKFIILFSLFMTAWILYNTLVPAKAEFDPYPFILMNLLLSSIAALQAPIIMMSQNRQEEKDRMRSENDYLINLKAELEIRSLHQKLDLLVEDQIRELYEAQVAQVNLIRELYEKLEKLEAK